MKKSNINYHNKTFRSVSNTENGGVSGDTVFHYRQDGAIVTATYSGGGILSGHLIAVIADDGKLEMRYHHINDNLAFKTGTCHSAPELLENGKLRLHEKWKWTCGDYSSGSSVIEEC